MSEAIYILKPVNGPAKPLDPDQAGGKAAALSLLASSRLGGLIPPWFVLARQAFIDSSKSWEFDRNSEEIPAGSLPIHPDVALSLEDAVREMTQAHPGALFAVRSSAIGEDGTESSHAGQLASVLNVKPRDVGMAVQVVWASAMAGNVRRYREHAARRDQSAPAGTPRPLLPAVLVQLMVPARVSGVAFSADPVNEGRERMIVSACRGLGDRLLSGETNGDTYYCNLQGTLEEQQIESGPVMNAAMLKSVAEMLRGLQEFFALPQEAEWAFAEPFDERSGQYTLYLLQSRPISTLNKSASPSAPQGNARLAGTGKILWDCGDLAENYGGVTLPLTFSFMRRVYDYGYADFCRVMGVSEKRIAAKRAVFGGMLGSLHGRMYRNMNNWNEWLSLFPKFYTKCRFIQQTANVSGDTPEDLPQPHAGARIMEGLRLAASGARLALNNLLLERKVKAFQKRVDAALSGPRGDYASMPLDRLAGEYRLLEEELRRGLGVPLLNEFLCVVALRASLRLLQKYGGEAGAAYHRDMLTGQKELISAEPARRIRQMAKLAAGAPQLIPVLQHGEKNSCLAALETHPTLYALINTYLERLGHRCPQELKLESRTLAEQPGALFSSIGRLAARWDQTPQNELPGNMPQTLEEVIGKGRWRNFITKRTASRAKKLALHRASLRFDRTRLADRVRGIFVCMGEKLHGLGVLEEPRDIFYLQLEEALGLIEGASCSTDLQSLARLRKAEYARFREMPAPPSRFVSLGAVFASMPDKAEQAVQAGPAESTATRIEANSMQGVGCCRGEATGRVRVVRDPRNAWLENGEILVADFADPGWVTLFADAAGVLTERGNLLSHSAVMAREFNIPAVVGLSGLTGWLKTGDVVTMDGATGLVRKLGD